MYFLSQYIYMYVMALIHIGQEARKETKKDENGIHVYDMIIKTNNLLPGTYHSGRRPPIRITRQHVISLCLQALYRYIMYIFKFLLLTLLETDHLVEFQFSVLGFLFLYYMYNSVSPWQPSVFYIRTVWSNVTMATYLL